MKTRISHALVASLALAGGLIGLAMAPIPGIWRILDDSRIALWKPPLAHITSVKVDNHGSDDVTVYVKPFPGAEVVLGVLPSGAGAIYPLPAGTVKVVIDDGMGIDLDSDGAKGTLLWLE
jgi:hypothetical protein